MKSDNAKNGENKKKGGARSSARLAAVQALYQMEISKVPAKIIVSEFIDHRLGEIIDDDQYSKVDNDFFNDIVIGVEQRFCEIDDHISQALSDDWTLERIESVARAVLRAGTYEIISRPDVPTSVIINEYIDLTKAFFEDNKPGFVNGVLDKLARKIRN